MNILFGSDFHQDMEAYKRFVSILNEPFYDIGVIGGDNCEYDFTLSEMQKMPGIVEDDLLEELYDPEDSIEDLNKRINDFRRSRNTPLFKAAKYKENRIRKILNKSKKTILVIRGNHDVSDWKSGKYIKNVENKSYILNGINFVGYRYTRLEIDEASERNDIESIMKLIKINTILVTHAPPFGILDENYRKVSIGSKPLAELSRTNNIIYHLFGHVHDSTGIQGKYINGSYPKNKNFYSIDTNKNVIAIV